MRVEKGQKYFVLIIGEDMGASVKEVTCKSEFMNLQYPRLELETTEEEHYPLHVVFKTKEAALNDWKRSLKLSISSLRREIRKNKKQIEEYKKKVKETENLLKNFSEKISENVSN